MSILPGEKLVFEYDIWESQPSSQLHRCDRAPGKNGVLDRLYYFSMGILNDPPVIPSYDRSEVYEGIKVRTVRRDVEINISGGRKNREKVISQTQLTGVLENLSVPPYPLVPPFATDGVYTGYYETIVPDDYITLPTATYEWLPDLPIVPVIDFPQTFDNYPPPNNANHEYYYISISGPLSDLTGFGFTEILEIIPTKIRYYRKADKPNYIDLLSGYYLDDRKIPDAPKVLPTEDKTIELSYYRENKLEAIPKLRSIDWLTYQFKLVKGVETTLPVVDCVLGTLKTDSSIESLLSSLSSKPDEYPYSYFLEESLPTIFEHWNALYNPSGILPPTLDEDGNGTIERRVLRVLGSNNNVWNNRPNPTLDDNYLADHPMFKVNNGRAYDWHVKPQLDGSYGDLIMDSPRIIAIATVLDALNLALDPATGLPRFANLGHLIHRIASLLGYRPEPDGTFKPEKEKAMVRQIVNSNEQIDPTKVGVNNFGSLGMIMRRLNNSFKGKKIVADECVIIRDIPQIMAEYQDQLNLALGLQESSAIEIKGTDNTARYDNQLAVMIELLNLVKSSNESIRAALISSLVAQAQSSEIIAALGLPTVTKSLPVNIDNKIDHLPYKGVSAHRSISQEIAVCTANVGIVLGQVL